VRRLLLLAVLALSAYSSAALPVSASQVDEWAQQHVAFKPGCSGGHCMTTEIISSRRRLTADDEAPMWCFTVRFRSGDQVEDGNLEGYCWTREDTSDKCYAFYDDGAGVYGTQDPQS
jgi:hypothetical protein